VTDLAVSTTHPGQAFSARVIRRDGDVSDFDTGKISVAMTKAFLAVEGDDAAASSRVHALVEELTGQVCAALFRHAGRPRCCTSSRSRTRSSWR
jgi:ribonucleoside-diphosphate reductase alpha chain